MSITKTFDFTDSTNFTFDTDVIEHTGTKLQLKNIANSNVPLVFGYEASIKGYINGVTLLDGTAVGGATIDGSGKLDLAHNDIRYVRYTIPTGTEGFNGSEPNKGCIRFNIIPNYDGSPASNGGDIAIGNVDAPTTRNAITLQHLSTGYFRIFCKDKNDTGVLEMNALFSAVSGQAYEIEFNYDYTDPLNPLTEVYVDGVRVMYSTDYIDRDDDVNTLWFGRDINTDKNSNFYLDWCFFFPTVQHTGVDYEETDDYISNSDISEIMFSNTDPTIEYDITELYASGVALYIDALEAFSDTHTNNTQHLLYKDDTAYYYSGGWVASDESYTQTTSATDIETNKATFTATGVKFDLRTLLNSDGDTSSDISALSFTYNFAPLPQDTINKTIVYGYINDIDGVDIDTTVLTIKLSTRDTVTYKDNVQIDNSIKTVSIGVDGYWEVELIDTENMNGNICYLFTFTNGEDVTEYRKKVPEATSKQFSELEDF